MLEYLRKLENEVSAWPNVSVHLTPIRRQGIPFRKRRIGHMHEGGIVDIPFPAIDS